MYNVCGHGAVGCAEDEDCSTGLYCNTGLAQPACQDYNECDINNVRMNGTGYCGENSTCSNSAGSFSCPCISGMERVRPACLSILMPGYVAFTAWVGCRDKNECTEGGHNCAANTDCTNLPGSWSCACKPGYTGSPTSGCTDINECGEEDLNTCQAWG